MSKDNPPIIPFKRKIRQVGDSKVVTIPKEIVEALEMGDGEMWEIYANDKDTLTMRRIKE